MFEQVRRWWNYSKTKTAMRFEENADPKVQLEQAIQDAQQQHQRLRQQAANVVANQKQTELRLNRALEELERTNTTTQQALRMASDASGRGDPARAEEYTRAAETLATRLLDSERDVDELRGLYLEATRGANDAKAAVLQNSATLKEKLAERQRLLSRLDQAKLQEQVNTAMASLSEPVGQDVPTFEEVRLKIEARYAKAKGMAELNESTSSSSARMFEIEQASRNVAANERLAQMRKELGLEPPPPPAPAPDAWRKELGP